jgi:hypothetical protein
MVRLSHAKRRILAERAAAGTAVLQVAAAACVLFLSACDKHKGQYFPLGEGVSWTYRQTVTIRNKGNAGAFEKGAYVAVATNLGEQKIGDADATPQLFADGRILYYRRDAEGVALVATREPGEPEPTAIPPRYIMKFPLKVGDSWQTDGRTEVLRRTFLGGFGSITKAVNTEAPIVYKVESVDDTVRVAAGTFGHCLRIHGTGSASILWGNQAGSINIDIDTVQWYAPKIGLVKEVRTEGTGQDGPLGGDLTEELAMVKRPGWFR